MQRVLLALGLVRKLNLEGFEDLLLVDDFSRADKNINLEGKRFREQMHRDDFLAWLEQHAAEVELVYHLGARTDTTENGCQYF